MLRSGPSRRHRRGRRSLLGGLRHAAFAALYGPLGPIYDRFTAAVFLGEWARWQEAALPFLPTAGLVVELGSGTGALAAVGAEAGRRWVGIEPSASMLRVARRRRAPDGPRFVRAVAQALPLPSAAADAVVATFPAPYIADPATAAELRRILKPGGRVVVVLGGDLAPHGPARRVLRAALAMFYGRSGQRAPAPFALVGFAERTGTVATRHGTATVYTGVVERTDARTAAGEDPAAQRARL